MLEGGDKKKLSHIRRVVAGHERSFLARTICIYSGKEPFKEFESVRKL